MEIKEVP